MELLELAAVCASQSSPSPTLNHEATRKAHNALMTVHTALRVVEQNIASMDAAVVEKTVVSTLDTFIRTAEKPEELVIQQGLEAILSNVGYVAPTEDGKAGTFDGPKPGLAKVTELKVCFHDAAAALASNSLFVQAVEKRRLEGKAVPLQDTASVPTLCHIEMYSHAIAAICSEDALKSFQSSLSKDVQALDRLISVVDNGQKSVVKNIEAFKKKQEQDKKKGERKAARQQLVQQRETTRAELPASKKCSFLDLSKHPAFVDMPRYDNLQALKGKDGVGLETPHILKEDNALKSFMEQRAVKASVGIFRIMFAQSDAAKADKTGQKAADFQDRARVREAMLTTVGSKQVAVPADDEAVSMRAIRNLAFFGHLAGYGLLAEERQGLPSVRYHISGSKEVGAWNVLCYSLGACIGYVHCDWCPILLPLSRCVCKRIPNPSTG